MLCCGLGLKQFCLGYKSSGSPGFPRVAEGARHGERKCVCWLLFFVNYLFCCKISKYRRARECFAGWIASHINWCVLLHIIYILCVV